MKCFAGISKQINIGGVNGAMVPVTDIEIVKLIYR